MFKRKRHYELQHDAPKRPHSGRAIGVIAIVVVAAAAATVWHGVRQHSVPVAATVQHRPAAAVQPAPEGVTSHLLFVGDVFWGRSVQTRAEASPLKYDYPTHGLTAVDRQAYDAWIANFECPITSRDIPYQQQVDNLSFNCRPEYLPNLAKWFTAVTLANNHMANNGGQWGLAQTRQNLQANGIQYFGSYDMSQVNDLCEVVSLPATTTVTHHKVAIPVALCGYMYVVDATPTDAQLDVMRQYARVMPVIAMPHMGVEYRPTAEAAKVSAYHRMIDAGADMVVGAHPHVIQNSEAYKGKLIAYSEGNFLFDQQSLGRATTLGLGVGVKLTIPDGTAANIYEKLAPACKAYKDSCLSQLAAALPARPVIHVSYDFTCFDESGGVPVKGNAAACAEAEQAAALPVQGLSQQW